ncbi:hypothetical protein FACS189490_10930 [Clostridia bacterium]|nr:hypothetical protein FACS189490_10930 [Clostridia bacterium]
MNKITEMILSAILKNGLLYDAKNVDTDIEIPMTLTDADGKKTEEKTVKINVKCDNMTLRIEKV